MAVRSSWVGKFGPKLLFAVQHQLTGPIVGLIGIAFFATSGIQYQKLLEETWRADALTVIQNLSHSADDILHQSRHNMDMLHNVTRLADIRYVFENIKNSTDFYQLDYLFWMTPRSLFALGEGRIDSGEESQSDFERVVIGYESAEDLEELERMKETLRRSNYFPLLFQAQLRPDVTLLSSIFFSAEGEAYVMLARYVEHIEVPGIFLGVLNLSNRLKEFIVSDVPTGLIMQVQYNNTRIDNLEGSFFNDVIALPAVLQEQSFDTRQISIEKRHPGSVWYYQWRILDFFDGGVQSNLGTNLIWGGGLGSTIIGLVLFIFGYYARRNDEIIARRISEYQNDRDQARARSASYTGLVRESLGNLRRILERLDGYATLSHETTMDERNNRAHAILHMEMALAQVGELKVELQGLRSVLDSEDGYQATNLTVFPLKMVIQRGLKDRQQRLDAMGIHVTTAVADDLPLVTSNSSFWKSLVGLLLDRSLSYSLGDGAVDIIAELENPEKRKNGKLKGRLQNGGSDEEMAESPPLLIRYIEYGLQAKSAATMMATPVGMIYDTDEDQYIRKARILASALSLRFDFKVNIDTGTVITIAVPSAFLSSPDQELAYQDLADQDLAEKDMPHQDLPEKKQPERRAGS